MSFANSISWTVLVSFPGREGTSTTVSIFVCFSKLMFDQNFLSSKSGWILSSSSPAFSNCLIFSFVRRFREVYRWRWNDLPNSFFRVLINSRVLSSLANGSPPVMPAPFALLSLTSLIRSFVEEVCHSLIKTMSLFFLFSDSEQ